MMSAIPSIPSLATILPTAPGSDNAVGSSGFQKTLDASVPRIDMHRVIKAGDTISPPDLRPTPVAEPASQAAATRHPSREPLPGPPPTDWKDLSTSTPEEVRAEFARLDADMRSGNADSRSVGVRLLRLQMAVQSAAFRSELATKVVDQVTGGVRNGVQTQV